MDNIESDLDENQKDFIYNYSNLQRKNKYEVDLKEVREKRKGSVISQGSLKRNFFSQDNLARSL